MNISCDLLILSVETIKDSIVKYYITAIFINMRTMDFSNNGFELYRALNFGFFAELNVIYSSLLG